jgi:hypothetical protein
LTIAPLVLQSLVPTVPTHRSARGFLVAETVEKAYDSLLYYIRSVYSIATELWLRNSEDPQIDLRSEEAKEVSNTNDGKIREMASRYGDLDWVGSYQFTSRPLPHFD